MVRGTRGDELVSDRSWPWDIGEHIAAQYPGVARMSKRVLSREVEPEEAE